MHLYSYAPAQNCVFDGTLEIGVDKENNARCVHWEGNEYPIFRDPRGCIDAAINTSVVIGEVWEIARLVPDDDEWGALTICLVGWGMVYTNLGDNEKEEFIKQLEGK